MTGYSIHQITMPTPFAVGDVHAYVVVGECVTLFDAGVNTEEAWNTLNQQLKEIGYQPVDIEQVVLTHHHPDHIGLLDRLDHVEHVLGHELIDLWLKRDQSYFRSYIDFFNTMYDRWGVPTQYRNITKYLENVMRFASNSALSQTIKEGDHIPGLEELVTIETPGHAQSHLSFYDQKTGNIIAGDHLIKHISSNPLLEPPYKSNLERPKPLLAYRESMKKMLGYNINLIYPGHGEVFSGHHLLISERLEKQEKRAHKVLSFLEDQPLNPFEICKKLFPKHYENEFGLTMSETVGQLDYLEAVGEIKEIYEGNRAFFVANKNYV
ncbi:MBL fold metallo-hydrolase [Alkalibacillus aidingensis]|uniref:MBL fold metallo-hydrolase n=1 Tax=Alkalibacillus aidingensis TaxID=2747607 RepID=UPI00166178E4|nr:MBL fold metallo-hydrolase [Alkalibacillus aidingensis]